MSKKKIPGVGEPVDLTIRGHGAMEWQDRQTFYCAMQGGLADVGSRVPQTFEDCTPEQLQLLHAWYAQMVERWNAHMDKHREHLEGLSRRG